MNTRKLFFGTIVTLCLVLTACTTNSSDDALYEVGVRKDQIRKTNTNSVRKDQIRKTNTRSVRKDQIRKSNS